MQERRYPVSILFLTDRKLQGLYESNFVLIRPDHVVAWRGKNLDHIGSVLEQVTGNAMGNFCQTPYIDKLSRAYLKKQKPFVIWFTGLSGSGKSTLANILDQQLFALNKHTLILDGDNIRNGLNKDLGYSGYDRMENIRRVSEVMKLAIDFGLIVIVSFISPLEEDRTLARQQVGATEFIEIYVDASLELCKKRDPKGLYAKAQNGEISDFTGLGSPYEVPKRPEIVIDSANSSPQDGVDKIIKYLRQFKYLT